MDEQQQQGWDWDLLSDDEGFLEEGKQQQSSSRMMPMEEEEEEDSMEKLMMPSSHMNIKSHEWDPVSQVSLKETDQFVEITPPAVMPWIEGADFQEKLGMGDSDDGGGSGSGSGGLNIWKWGLSGILGAICSIGVGTVCMAMLGQGKNHGFHPHLNYKNQNCSNDQRMKHHELVIGRGGGIPMSTAHITFGGYYDSPLAL